MRVLARVAGVAAVALALTAGCGDHGRPPEPTSSGTKGMYIAAAGATFPYPVYARWAEAYAAATGARLNYQSIGSGGGIAQIKAETVDLGATDAPLTRGELDRLGLVQWPQVMGGVVLVVHLDGIGPDQLRLTPQLVADIFLGRLTSWNDPSIAALNPDLALPAREIGVVHRADASGTTWIFTNYLSKVSETWRSQVGNSTAVAWPVGAGGKGNEGVAAYVQRLTGTIGYVEFAYALQNHMTTTLLENAAGRFVAPSLATFRAAAANARWTGAPDFYEVLTDEPGPESWPITGASFILFHRSQPDPAKAREVLDFFSWAFDHGDQMAADLDYVPIPDAVVRMVKQMWATEITSDGRKVWTP